MSAFSSICKSMKSWLDSDSAHVAVVHCKVCVCACVYPSILHHVTSCDHLCRVARAGQDVSYQPSCITPQCVTGEDYCISSA